MNRTFIRRIDLGMDDYDNYSSDDEIAEFRRRNEATRRARELAKKAFSEEFDDYDAINKVRKQAKETSDTVLAEYDEAQKQARVKDQEVLQYIDDILKNTEKPFQSLRWRNNHLIGRYYRSNNNNKPNGAENRNGETNVTPTPRSRHYRRRTSLPAFMNTSSVERPRVEVTSLVDGYIREPSSAETARQRMRRIEERLEGILDYELPSAENFKTMRHSLREITDKMSQHRMLLDRSSGIDLTDDGGRVSERIDEKYRELEERMPCLTMSQRQHDEQKRASRFDPNFIPGYATGLSITSSEQNTELRGRIRALLCRTKATTGTHDKHVRPVRQRRETTVN